MSQAKSKRFILPDGRRSNNPEGFQITITSPTGDIDVLYDPHPKQLQFHQATQPNVLFYGGRGSGKSAALRWEAHIRALAHPGFKYAILRRTYPELQNSHLRDVPREMKKLGGTYNYTNREAHYPNGSVGVFTHCQNPGDELNLLSAEFAWMGFDELSTFNWEMFLKLAASVRVTDDSGLTAMVRAATNPLGPSAQEVLKFFVNKDVDLETYSDYNPSDWHSFKANLEDNPSLDHDQYIKRFSGLQTHVRKAWVDGDFMLENSLFDFYPEKWFDVTDEQGNIVDTVKRPYHVIPSINIEDLVTKARIYRVYDHGYAPDPAYCAWIAHLGNRYIVFHECIWLKTIVSDIAADIKATDERLGIKRVITTYCDPTTDIHTGHEYRTIKGIFEANGVPMECSVNNREQFASAVHTALAEEAEPGVPRLQIFVGPKGHGAHYLAKAIPMQQYDIKRPLALANSAHDHPVVAVAYFLISHSSNEQRTFSTKDLPRWMRPKHSDESWRLGNDNVRDYR